MARSGARRDLAISVEGLAGLRKAFKRVEGNLDREVRDSIKDIVEDVRDEARATAPRRGGDLVNSLRASVTQTKGSVYSTLEYAGVVEYGRLRRAPFTGREFLANAVRRQQTDVTSRLEELLDMIGQDYEKD